MNRNRYRFEIFAIPLILSATSPAFDALASDPPESRSAAQGSKPQPKQEGVVGKTDQEKAVFEKFVRHEPQFKDHYQAHYAASGYDYNQYRPAYQRGFELALDPRYAAMDWSALEPQARRSWNDSTMGLWDQYKDAVRYGWEQGHRLDRG